MATTADPLGAGIRRPFRRGPNGDFLQSSGADLVQSNVGQVMGTMPGECRWRPSFGGNLSALRHRNNTTALNELARLTLQRAFSRWMPRLRLLGAVADPISTANPNRVAVSGVYQVGNTEPGVAQVVI